jgi:hypothetical protein
MLVATAPQGTFLDRINGIYRMAGMGLGEFHQDAEREA